MRRTLLFDPEHEAFRQLCRTFFQKECVPFTAEWERAGHVDREVWRKAGAAGMLLWEVPESYGGAGIEDYRYSVALIEEYYAAGVAGFGLVLQNDVMPPYLLDLTTDEQKARWLPGSVSGDIVWALAMSEPAAGSDLKAMRTTARRDGDHYILDGSKTFITNGLLSDAVVVAAKTDPTAGHKGISLLVVEEGMPGFTRGRKLDKIGQHAQDTAELFFDNVRVPVTNLLGEEHRGFYALMRGLPKERLGCAVTGMAAMKRAFSLTVEQVRTRQVFGQSLGGFQNTRFELADVKATLDAVESYVDRAIAAHLEGALSAEDAAGLKQWVTDRQFEVVDRCLQLFGGYGYMTEYEIARIWRDSRVQRIYAGSNEVMKEIVGRSLDLEASS